jgi:hypothetical protein
MACAICSAMYLKAKVSVPESKIGAEMRRKLDEDVFDVAVIDVTQPGHEDGSHALASRSQLAADQWKLAAVATICRSCTV